MKKFWTEGGGSFFLAVGVALFVRWALMEAYVIPSGSMLPSLLVNDHIFINKVVYGVRVPFTTDWLAEFSSPKRGDVIVFKYPANPKLYYIKRVIGTPGDHILYENGNLYVNHELVERELPGAEIAKNNKWLTELGIQAALGGDALASYVHWQETLDGRSYGLLLKSKNSTEMKYGPYVVPARHYFVLGDNRDNSQDSRFWSQKSQRATGEVKLTLKEAASDLIEVPKGTIFTTAENLGDIQRYRSLESVKISVTSPQSVAVEALSPGGVGNVKALEVINVESLELSQKVKVENLSPIIGGKDYRFVPRENIVGRAMFVWLSCSETLPLVSFLCHPFKIRWGRSFHGIQ